MRSDFSLKFSEGLDAFKFFFKTVFKEKSEGIGENIDSTWYMVLKGFPNVVT